jgi:hypothetical protein
MLNLSPSDLAFVVDRLNRRGKIYTAKAPVGRRIILEASLGYHDAFRLAALLGAHEPRPNGTKWRVRVRDTAAKELVTGFLPHLSEKDRNYALVALAQAEQAPAA